VKIFSWISLLGLVFSINALLAWSAKAQDGATLLVEEVRVVSATGMVAAKSADGKSITIKLGAVSPGETPAGVKLGTGSMLVTGPASGAYVSIPSVGMFKAGPNTEVMLPKKEEPKTHSLEMLKGQMFMNLSADEIKKRGNATFRLKTPASLLAVKGTRFFALGQKKGTIVGLHQGSVEVTETASSQSRVLSPGNAVEVSAGSIGTERPLTDEEAAFEKFYSYAAIPAGGFTNSLGMKLVPVPGTHVLFCIHETRRQDYAAFAAASPGVDDSWKSGDYNGVPYGHEDAHPVVSVSWGDAEAFCHWISNKEGLIYRLPTDREWSYAVGIGQKEKASYKDYTIAGLSMSLENIFPWGGRYPPVVGDKIGNYADSAFKEKAPSRFAIKGYADGFPTTAPVMSFKPNKLGIYDLGGNASEYCEDWYDPKKEKHLTRGASWYNGDPGVLKSSHRSSCQPDSRSHDDGFRVVLVRTGD
jgi:hypothetical protein